MLSRSRDAKFTSKAAEYNTRQYKNNLFYKLSKYKFNIKEIEFLGFLIRIKDIYIDPK
jgi:hypothetical protein